MGTNRHNLARAAMTGLAVVALISGCSSGDKALTTGGASKPDTTAATATTDASPTTEATATTDASPTTEATEATEMTTVASTEVTAATTEVTEATTTAGQGGSASRPEGSWTIVNRLEAANPPYDEFVPGKPEAQRWEILPQCDDGLCDLTIEPGDDPLADVRPAGYADEIRPSTLELQDDNTFYGRDEIADPTCVGSDGANVSGGGARIVEYSLIFVPAEGAEAPRLEGEVTVNQLPNATGLESGCIEFHDKESLLGQPSDAWTDLDPSTLTFGTYDWGGWVRGADQYYADTTAKVGDYVSLSSDLVMDPGCTGEPCELAARGVVPAYGDEPGTFEWDGERYVARTSREGTCVKNGTDEVIAEHGYDDVVTITLTPVIVVGRTVLAWVGEYTQVGTPTAEAAAASPEDCFPQHLEVGVAAATTRPYFVGL